ncbi:MAG: hypothetical protein ACK5LN_07800 [Propioniciclava sp.]
MNAAWLVLPGMLVAFGMVLMVSAFRTQHARLADALATMGEVTPPPMIGQQPGLERVGAAWLARYPQLAPEGLDRQLQLRGRTMARHVGIKLAVAAGGFLLPFLGACVWWGLAGSVPLLPVIACLVLAGVGFILPDIQLRMQARQTEVDATEALLVFFDLVTLERLANRSATQALRGAAAMSDATIFASIRAALDRAQLQQRLPYGELRELGRTLKLQALVDLADVMRLDEAGASLASTLRARVQELRGAHLIATKMHAAEVSERMTFFMVFPSLMLALFFLVPPLLTLAGSG